MSQYVLCVFVPRRTKSELIPKGRPNEPRMANGCLCSIVFFRRLSFDTFISDHCLVIHFRRNSKRTFADRYLCHLLLSFRYYCFDDDLGFNFPFQERGIRAKEVKGQNEVQEKYFGSGSA